ncbi:hypothetical protein B0H67DRAFT_338170 [Lasiosphaeris hirsuta]|uniref:Uncharacterized protein n=1 Tax=Lasiosphaeris hirsuta TaxID=260670 RepID=A0AA40A304_9PEZI|nr:hypothetical protein B0H67DRAFT_338170 [Lasiosphaeris hirsuta]
MSRSPDGQWPTPSRARRLVRDRESMEAISLSGIQHFLEPLPVFCGAWCPEDSKFWALYNLASLDSDDHLGPTVAEYQGFPSKHSLRGIPPVEHIGPGDEARIVWLDIRGQGLVGFEILISDKYPASIVHIELLKALFDHEPEVTKVVMCETYPVLGPHGGFQPIGVQTIAMSITGDPNQLLEGVNCLVHKGSPDKMGGFIMVLGKRDYDHLKPLLDQVPARRLRQS